MSTSSSRIQRAIAAVNRLQIGDLTAEQASCAYEFRQSITPDIVVVTVSPGERKAQVIKAIRKVMDNSLLDAKNMTEGKRAQIEGWKLDQLKQAVMEAGGTVLH
jgi:ribosomal protein L7/L12